MSGLVVDAVSVRFGGHAALSQVSLSAVPGMVTGLIGPNGAGKTTLFNVVCGLQKPTAGRVSLNGRDVTSLPAHRRARAGLARTFQRLELFTALDVRTNVRLAAELRRPSRGTPVVDAGALTDQLLDRVGLTDLADARADELPTGQARLVEVARALATEPSVLLLDEPASGLTDDETDGFAELLRAIAAEGTAVLLVEHDVRLVMSVCLQVHVLDFGRVIASGSPLEVQRDAAVLTAYLGAL